MNLKILLFWGFLLSISACKKEEIAFLNIEYHGINTDTLIISEVITDEILAKFPLDENKEVYQVVINHTMLTNLNLKNGDSGVLSILSPGHTKYITVKKKTIENQSGKADSLINDLWKSTNEMFTKHNRIIFAEEKPDSVLILFDSLIIARAKSIADETMLLSKDELTLLNYQNSARAYSFLMFYGRIIKDLPPENGFFDFIKDIDNDNPFIKTLPDNVLYKLEIEYLRKYDSIASLDDFVGYISQKIENKDLRDFLTAIYLKSVIESPSYWARHVQLFNTQSISKALDREMDNKYKRLIESASSSFYSSQAGMEAYNFTAENAGGQSVQLLDMIGSVVLIDTWATWCGPCIGHRPQILDLALKYSQNPRIKILMISVDSSIDKWKDYIERTNPEKVGLELIIPDGMNTLFGDKYLIKSIPKYILIDHKGIIIHSNLSEPSLQMEKLIDEAASF